MPKAISILGTGSGVGKSLIAAGLLRILKDLGINVAPFKAQNMALNSFITKEGGEIGRAQALQAEAARIEPSIHMNPVLLKASADMGCQVIFHGKVFKTLKAKEYYALKELAWQKAITSFEILKSRHDIIVMEGAGSPAEINLMEKDIVNIPMAKYANSKVLLVGDIDRGGVFASLFGTVELLRQDKSYVKGFIINKFRGDRSILEPGLEKLKELTGIPTLGVLPYVAEMGLPEEDGLVFSQRQVFYPNPESEIRIAIVRLPYISNFTDFDPLIHEPDVSVSFTLNPTEIEQADIVIIPGTKSTEKDLQFLKRSSIHKSIFKVIDKGRLVIGICGGYQMLGKKLIDPKAVETENREADGLGIFDMETVFNTEKVTSQVLFKPTEICELWSHNETVFTGYEIHMGISYGMDGIFEVTRFREYERERHEETVLDGSFRGPAMGTYIHGLFENDLLRRALLNLARKQKGLPGLDIQYKYRELKEQRLDYLADLLRNHLNLPMILRILEI